jgi:hypothetical protein
MGLMVIILSRFPMEKKNEASVKDGVLSEEDVGSDSDEQKDE